MIRAHKNPFHVLLVDDDPIFRAVVKREAAKKNIALTTCDSKQEFDTIALPGMFDAAIIDHYLDGVEAELRGSELVSLLKATPIVIVSGNLHAIEDYDPWPGSVLKFVPKQAGIERILDTTLQTIARAYDSAKGGGRGD